MKSEPSPGATRAAEKISLTVAQAADDVWPNLKSMGDWEKRLAEIIDEHTCHKELVEAVQESLTYFDQRADVQTANPFMPNEEMRLWEELNNALSA